MRRVILCVFCIATFSGCFSAKMIAPRNADVKVLTENETTNFKKEVRMWYALWGLVPISEVSSAQTISENDLTEVRVTTKFKFVDYLIGIFTGVASIVPMTMQIEGNSSANGAAMNNPDGDMPVLPAAGVVSADKPDQSQ